MSGSADAAASPARRAPVLVAVRKRPDLDVREQRYEGEICFIIKDPVALKYFRFREPEYFILDQLNGRRTAAQICDAYAARFPGQELEEADLGRFIQQLHGSSLLVEEGTAVRPRRPEKKVPFRLLAAASNVLYIKLPGFDPEPLLRFLHRWTGWLFSKWGVAGALCLSLTALLLVTMNADVLRNKPELQNLQSLLTPERLLWLWLALGAVKILHEFGHGIACKHFGGECHDMGVLLLVLSPCLYCNVSDAWILPNKWHRIAISSAGIYIELILASVATIVWWSTQAGILQDVCLAVMIIASLNTVLLNANPLMKYDGYYILTDLLEIPNLRQKSAMLTVYLFQKWCLGLDVERPKHLPERNQWLFSFYAIAAYAYTWFLMAVILWFLYRFLVPYQLGSLGQLLALLTFGNMIGVPIYLGLKHVRSNGVKMQIAHKLRPILTASLAVLLLVGVFVVPLPFRVQAVLTVEPKSVSTVFTQMGGRIVKIFVKPGESIEAGSPLIELVNDELQLEIAELQSQVQIMRAKLNTYAALERHADERLTLARVKQFEQDLASRERQAAQLIMRSPRAGVVIPPALKHDKGNMADEQQPVASWSGTPLDPENIGMLLPQGSAVCSIGNPREPEAVLIIDQDLIEFVREQQPVRVKLEVLPSATLTGSISEIGVREVSSLPEQLGNKAGSELLIARMSNGELKPLKTYFQVRVPLGEAFHQLPDWNPESGVITGSRGRARIFCGYRTGWQRLRHWFGDTFQY